ncbi:MAG TPA: hypothetical protein VM755_17740 [Stellaceae bacterium]|nr:hypothetical protein [Stellaceae bacterium]
MEENHAQANGPTRAEHPQWKVAAGVDALIERWWEDHFPGSAVAGYTEAWNVAHSAKEALKALLKKGDRQCS